ncbi:unnamed protein product [Penicillium camemberti]|uniref:Str. FM013 n=1 Tax=Penicillium camemberti (strain FM 013) TaxID=1429867 RepID=A0A0G4PBY8_PENC3|nr:unnamed protein product [Penicillium camemberti]
MDPPRHTLGSLGIERGKKKNRELLITEVTAVRKKK